LQGYEDERNQRPFYDARKDLHQTSMIAAVVAYLILLYHIAAEKGNATFANS
jgi:hypothetical protein